MATTQPTLPAATADAIRAAGAAERGGKNPSKTTKKPGAAAAATTTTIAAAASNGDVNFGATIAEALANGGGEGSTKVSNPKAVINMTGISGIGGKTGRLTAGDWQTSLNRLSQEDLKSLQTQLWEGGFYPSQFYYQNGPRPVLGERIDAGLDSAYVKFINLAIDNKQFAANDILQTRRKQYASSVANAGGGSQNALNVQVEPTQSLPMPKDAALGAIANAAAQKVLGRNLKEGEERDHYVEMIRAALMESGMTEADINAYNRGLQRSAIGQEAAFSNAQAGGDLSSTLTGSMADYAGAIRAIESGNGNPAGNYTVRTKAKDSTASGAYQITNTTWGNYKGYKSAKDAPPEIQDEFFNKVFGDYIKKFGSPQLAALAWFQGPGVAQKAKSGDKSVLAKTDSLGTSANGYIAKFNKTLASVQGGKSAAQTQATGSASGGLTTVTTLTGNYKGSVATPSGGNVVVTPSNENIQATIEEAIKKEKPEEAGAVGFRKTADVFERLMRGGY